MPMNKDQIQEVMDVLKEWQPLGEKAKKIKDLNNYHTEAIDILFNIDNPFINMDTPAMIQDLFNGTFNTDLTLEQCIEPAKKIRIIYDKYKEEK